MDNITNEQFNQALDRLPKSAQEFVTSQEFSDNLIKIGKKYLLHVDQMGNLSELIIYTTVGILPISDFQKNVIKKVGIPEDILNLIIYDINQQVFLPLKQKLYFSSPSSSDDKKVSTQENEVGQEEENENSITNPTPDTFADKMTAEYGLSREKVEISDQPNQSEPPQPNNTPPRHDPYREPLP